MALARFDLNRLEFSLILMRPKRRFFEWLRGHSRKRGIAASQLYYPEEDGVVLIPYVGSFADGTFDAYVEALKPTLVRDELARFGLQTIEAFEWTACLCDEFFELEIRDRARVCSKEEDAVQRHDRSA